MEDTEILCRYAKGDDEEMRRATAECPFVLTCAAAEIAVDSCVQLAISESEAMTMLREHGVLMHPHENRSARELVRHFGLRK